MLKTFLILVLFFACGFIKAQDSLLQARLKSLKGATAPFSQLAKKDSLFLICFWATTSDESIAELNAINADLDKWKSAVPFRFMAISIDEGKDIRKLRPTYNMNSWTFELYNDLYGDLRRALHSNNLPQSMVIFKNQLIYQQSGWTSGSENYLFQKLLSIHSGRQ